MIDTAKFKNVIIIILHICVCVEVNWVIYLIISFQFGFHETVKH